MALSSPESLLARRRPFSKLHIEKKSYIRKQFPSQCLWDEVTQSYLLYKPRVMIEALGITDMLSENPWVMGGGKSTFVLVDGEEIRQRYIEWGCNENKIIITGCGVHDDLFNRWLNKENARNLICEKYRFDKNNKLILVALPQFAEEAILDLGEHLNEIHFLLENLNNLEKQIV